LYPPKVSTLGVRFRVRLRKGNLPWKIWLQRIAFVRDHHAWAAPIVLLLGLLANLWPSFLLFIPGLGLSGRPSRRLICVLFSQLLPYFYRRLHRAAAGRLDFLLVLRQIQIDQRRTVCTLSRYPTSGAGAKPSLRSGARHEAFSRALFNSGRDGLLFGPRCGRNFRNALLAV